MKSKIIFFIFFLCISILNSQSYKEIDNKIKKYPKFDSIETLAIRVNNDFENDTQKARAYYTWIAINIEYDIEAYYSPFKEKTFSYIGSKDYNSQKKRYHQKVLKKAFKDKKALCLGYSLLYKQLCELSNIECKIIRGVTKVNVYEINNIRNIKDHSWNAVFINNKWHLIDVTWSSGYENASTGRWSKKFNDLYFFTNPDIFITSHYPEKKEWQLLTDTITLKSFFSKPIFYNHYFENNLKINQNQNGNLYFSSINKGNVLTIRFNNKSKKKLRYTFSNENITKYVKLKKINNNNYIATIKHPKKHDSTLTLYLDNLPILGFKVVSK